MNSNYIYYYFYGEFLKKKNNYYKTFLVCYYFKNELHEVVSNTVSNDFFYLYGGNCGRLHNYIIHNIF